LVLGRILPYSAVGLYNRAQTVSSIPNQSILTSVFSVAFPALAAEIRQGRGLKEPYLRALGLITVFYWPAQVLLALLAYPIVALLLGEQWFEVVPLLQVMAVAGLAWFPVMLTSPVLLALGENRDRVLADLVGRSISAIVLCSVARFGIMAMAVSKLVTLPFQMMLSLWYVRRHVGFRWREVWASLWRSAVVTVGTAAGPVGAVALSDSGFDLPIAVTLLALVSAVCGWLATVLLTQHPVLLELRKVAQLIVRAPFVTRLRDHIIASARWAGGGAINF
jgi:lipopolysaccharide exporter